MTKHKALFLLDDLASSSSGRVRQRLPLDQLPEDMQSHIRRLAPLVSHAIQDAEDNDGIINKDVVNKAARSMGMLPHQFISSIQQVLVYCSAYPDASVEQALCPAKLPNKGMSNDPVDALSVPKPRPIKKRPHIMSVEDPTEREQIIQYAKIIADLLYERSQRKREGYYGRLKETARELGQTKQWVTKEMNHLAAYRAAYGHEQDYNDANAFVKLPPGRPKGRLVSPEVQEAVEKARLNTRWESLNSDGTTSSIEKPINATLVHSLIEKASDNAPSYTSVWRMIKDVEQAHPTLYLSARESMGDARNSLPSITFKSRGVWEYTLLDIRPLPMAVLYNGIVCTIRAIVVIDHHSGYGPVWHLLPAKRLEGDEAEVIGQDYTCQKIRELLAIAMMRVNARPHIIYPDKGPQFIEAALGKYMEFLWVPEESLTHLINREGERPRGGGAVENALRQLDAFVHYRKTYISEKRYRSSLKRNRRLMPPLYEDIVDDFDVFMNSFNTESIKGKPSRWECFKNSPWHGLTLPSIQNLSVFALTCNYDTRRPKPEGFSIDAKLYVPERKDIELYAALADENTRAELDPAYEVPICILEFGQAKMVLFSLDKGRTWERAIPKDQDLITADSHSKLLKKAEALYKQKGKEAATFIRTLLGDRESPIVLNALHATPQFETIAEAHQHIQDIKESPLFQPMPTLSTELAAPDQEKPESQPKGKSNKRSKGKTSQQYPSQRPPHLDTASTFTADSDESIDLDDFLSALGYTFDEEDK